MDKGRLRRAVDLEWLWGRWLMFREVMVLVGLKVEKDNYLI